MAILDRFRVDDRVAIITGGSRGLGAAMADALAGAGANVVVANRDAEKIQVVAQKLQSTYGHECRGYRCDVTDPAQVEALVAQVIADFGRIDILVNNAGVDIRGEIEDISLQAFRHVQETNVTGVWLMCRAVAPYMKARHCGRVINVGSMLSIVSIPQRSPYAASKGAVLQLTRTLALEWAPYGITVNAILPGPFATEINRPRVNNPQKSPTFVDQIPLGRWGKPEEIGGLVLFLASEASSFVTGAAISIDGGWTAR